MSLLANLHVKLRIIFSYELVYKSTKLLFSKFYFYPFDMHILYFLHIYFLRKFYYDCYD